jgi:hypothetical protein
MWKTLVLVLLLAACGGKTGVYKDDYSGSLTLTLVNMSPRTIEEVFIYPIGSQAQGSSWTEAIPPGATRSVKIRSGNFELVAVSAKRNIDQHTRERPQATTSLELKSDQKLVFHDAGDNPAGLDAKGTLGVTFQISPAETKPDATEPTTESAPEAPAASP